MTNIIVRHSNIGYLYDVNLKIRNMSVFKEAEIQIAKEIMEAVIFLRENNHTIPSDTIEFMKIASLEKLKANNE